MYDRLLLLLRRAPYFSGHPSTGDIYIADGGNFTIRKVSQNEVSDFVGNGMIGSLTEFKSGTAIGVDAILTNPVSLRLALDGASLLLTESAQAARIVRIDLQTRDVSMVAGGNGEGGEDGIVSSATINAPNDIAEEKTGAVWFSSDYHMLGCVTHDGHVKTKAGKYSEVGCSPWNATAAFNNVLKRHMAAGKNRCVQLLMSVHRH